MGISRGGLATPSSFLIVAVILGIFAIGYVLMSKRIQALVAIIIGLFLQMDLFTARVGVINAVLPLIVLLAFVIGMVVGYFRRRKYGEPDLVRDAIGIA